MLIDLKLVDAIAFVPVGLAVGFILVSKRDAACRKF